MPIDATDRNEKDQNAVMSWLQDREMRDHKLADARSGLGGKVLISSTIGRLQEKAYLAFPHIAPNVIDGLVRKYVDPRALLQSDNGV